MINRSFRSLLRFIFAKDVTVRRIYLGVGSLSGVYRLVCDMAKKYLGRSNELVAYLGSGRHNFILFLLVWWPLIE
jgi:hypothetical protein